MQFTSILSGFISPVALAAPDQSALYIADQVGIVYKCDLSTHQVSIFLDVRVNIPPLDPNYDERGLLGLCFHPQFKSNGRFYIFYSSVSLRYGEGRDYGVEFIRQSKEFLHRGKVGYQPQQSTAQYYNCLSEFVTSNDKIVSERVLIRIPRDLNYHNGGKIGFGNDGYLYVTVGDGGPQEDPNGHAQDLNSPFGKIYRIDVGSGSGYSKPPFYSIPEDNPFIDDLYPEIYAYGFRNPWGLDFYNDKLIVTDVGYKTSEEINIVSRGGNYGWNIKEGFNFTPWAKGSSNNFIDPIFAYPTRDPSFSDGDSSAIIGGYLRRNGSSLEYICADHSGKILRLNFPREIFSRSQSKSVQVLETVSLHKFIQSFGKDADGNIYVLTSQHGGPSGTTGEVFRID